MLIFKNEHNISDIIIGFIILFGVICFCIFIFRNIIDEDKDYVENSFKDFCVANYSIGNENYCLLYKISGKYYTRQQGKLFEVIWRRENVEELVQKH